jgi:hypothetical protein
MTATCTHLRRWLSDPSRIVSQRRGRVKQVYSHRINRALFAGKEKKISVSFLAANGGRLCYLKLIGSPFILDRLIAGQHL